VVRRLPVVRCRSPLVLPIQRRHFEDVLASSPELAAAEDQDEIAD
jgi:hypothetical protein